MAQWMPWPSSCLPLHTSLPVLLWVDGLTCADTTKGASAPGTSLRLPCTSCSAVALPKSWFLEAKKETREERRESSRALSTLGPEAASAMVWEAG